MGASLKRITVQGFKSIRNLENFELRNLNVLIGANGSGKSNFLSLFRLMSSMTRRGGLGSYAILSSRPNKSLFRGIKTTSKITIDAAFCPNDRNDREDGFAFELVPDEEGKYLLIGNEKVYSRRSDGETTFEETLGVKPSDDPILLKKKERAEDDGVENIYSRVFNALSSSKIYHFHDTSSTAGMRRMDQLVYLKTLDSNADQLASFLYYLRNNHPKIYRKILKRVQLVLPFLEDFDVEPDENEGIMLKWRQKGVENYTFGPSQLSDGGIRYICLVTALLQPNLPSTLIIDEPELGLHPEAVELLGELIKSASTRTQIIIATQSSLLLDAFVPEDVITVVRENGESTFNRLGNTQLDEWLEEFSLGELWRRNIVEGGTNYEWI